MTAGEQDSNVHVPILESNLENTSQSQEQPCTNPRNKLTSRMVRLFEAV